MYNGLVLLTDDETGTYWDHITGKAVHGPLQGRQLDVWPIQMTNVRAALQADPDLEIALSEFRSIRLALLRLLSRFRLVGKRLPPHFGRTMGVEDGRRPRMELGLGVIAGGSAKFYPLSLTKTAIHDTWQGRRLRITPNPVDGTRQAAWEDDGSRPMQLLARWYGFSLTYPHCEIYQPV